MKLEKYGITLIRLTEDKIELVRNWRNDPKIVKYMEFKDFITPDMQKNWYNRINNANNFYFLIIDGNKEVGLINIRDIDFLNFEGEAGIFIYDDKNSIKDVSFRSILCLYDFCFEELKLKKILAHILKDNKVSIILNKLLGYKKAINQEVTENQLYYLTLENYNIYKEKLLISMHL